MAIRPPTEKQLPEDHPIRLAQARRPSQAEVEAARLAKKVIMTDALRKEHLDNIRRDEKHIEHFMRDGGTPTRNRFPEHMFRENFLPIITGDAFKRLPEGMSEDDLREQAHVMWSRVAGSPTAEVDVVEPDGSVAFTMPPMSSIKNANTSHPRETAPPIAAYTKKFMEKAAGQPTIAKAYLNRGISEKIAHMFSTVDTEAERIEESKKLEKMRDYYGLPKDAKGPGNKVADKPSGTGNLGELSFDD